MFHTRCCSGPRMLERRDQYLYSWSATRRLTTPAQLARVAARVRVRVNVGECVRMRVPAKGGDVGSCLKQVQGLLVQNDRPYQRPHSHLLFNFNQFNWFCPSSRTPLSPLNSQRQTGKMGHWTHVRYFPCWQHLAILACTDASTHVSGKWQPGCLPSL